MVDQKKEKPKKTSSKTSKKTFTTKETKTLKKTKSVKKSKNEVALEELGLPVKRGGVKKTKRQSKPKASAAVAEQASPEFTEEDLLELVQKNEAIPLATVVYQIWQGWADFELTVLSPALPEFNPPRILKPETIPNSKEVEFVYPIHDYGYKLVTSKQNEIFSSGRSMCKMFYTIEKIIATLVARLEHEQISPETEVQVALNGHECALRKGFEVIINLVYNVVIMNYDPGVWAERYLKLVKMQADLGYPYPTQAPRDVYKHNYEGTKPRMK